MDLLYLLRLRFRFRRETRFHFFHHPALYAAVLDRLGTPDVFPRGVALYTPERARVRYAEGEAYHVGFAVAVDGPIAPRRLVTLLGSGPTTEFGRSTGAPFGNNLRLEGAFDLVASRALGREPPVPLTRKHLSQSIAELAARKEITIRFLSPLRILRTPITPKAHVLDGEVFDVWRFLRGVRNSIQQWWPGTPFANCLPEIAEGEAKIATLVWNRMIRADVPYPRKRIIGSSGSVCLRFPDGVGPWAEALLLAGVIGAGTVCNMGAGRFEIAEQPLPVGWPPAPARTLLERAADFGNLDQARLALCKAGPAPGIDGLNREEFLDALTHDIGRIQHDLCSGQIRATPLAGLLLRERRDEDGREKLRPLALPTLRDRFLQRAILQELTPAIDQLLEDSSFAYRRGFAVRTAQRRVDELRRNGFTHVLDADIRSFFDTVDWAKLRVRLEAYLGCDPVIDLLMAWVQAPVEFEGRTIPRDAGLPQGAVVSPLLANLYLDAFDEAVGLNHPNLRLVRYADDFLILCQRKEDIPAARQLADDELKKLSLCLNPNSTETSFEEGFRFLGSVFCRSVVLDANRRSRTVLEVLDRMPAEMREHWEKISAAGWLADFLSETAQETAAVETGPLDSTVRRRRPLVLAGPDRKPVYVVTGGARLIGRRRGLYIEVPDEQPLMVAWGEMAELVVIGGHYVSTSVFQRAMEQKVPLAFHRWDGSPVGLVLPHGVRSPSPSTILQWEWLRDPARRLGVSRLLVEAKIRNLRLMVRRRREEVARLLDVLARGAQDAAQAETLDSVRGLEGQAAHAYFSCWNDWVIPDFRDFPGRVSPRAADPLNAMLNLLYTQLFRKTQLSIFAAGLDPYLGVLHEGGGRYAALASDLMEPFRFLVDATVLNAVNHRHVTRAHFTCHEKGPYPIRLSPPALKRLLADFEARWSRQVADVCDRVAPFFAHLHRQTVSLRRTFEGQDPQFQPFRMKW